MPPVPVTADHFPRTIYGVHDLEAAPFLTQNRCSGWLVHSVKVDSDPPADYTPFLSQGLRVIVRLNHDYADSGNGTIPLPAQYEAFAALVANWVLRSKGAVIWMIGNEMNRPSEYPSGQPITPQLYAGCFNKCRNAIHTAQGHGGDPVIPGAVAPWNTAQGDWVQYFQMIYSLLRGNCDGISLHTYTHGSTADRITDEARFPRPYQNLHYNFRTYRDFLGAVPADMKSLPVFITEAQTVLDAGPAWSHQSAGWVEAAYAEIDAWNADAKNQPIQALVLSRWKAEGRYESSLVNFPEIQTSLGSAIARNYALTPPRSGLGAAQSLDDAALAAAKSRAWMPVNNQAALWKYAQANGLQDQQTDEMYVTYNGASYVLQVFNKGIVYVKFGDWSNIKVIPK